MQIIFLPEWATIALFFMLWAAFQLGASVITSYLPNSVFKKDGWLYKSRSWEKRGKIYEVLKIRQWKKYLPDGGAWSKRGYSKKHLNDFSAENLNLFLIESRRAELTHWLCIIPFWVFGFFGPIIVVPIMLAYALVSNLPCIITQRYNRPRIEALMGKRVQQVHTQNVYQEISTLS